MCLRTVDKKTKKGTGVGYKCFDIDEWYHISPEFQCRGRYYYDKWYTDDNQYKIEATNGELYQAGYHIFTKLEDAQLWGGQCKKGSLQRRCCFW